MLFWLNKEVQKFEQCRQIFDFHRKPLLNTNYDDAKRWKGRVILTSHVALGPVIEAASYH